jgi:TolB protein
MKKLRTICPMLIIFILCSPHHTYRSQPVGAFDHHGDIGDPKIKGSATYNSSDQTYTLSGAGKNMWTNADQFQFLWKKIKGDFIINATVRFIGKGTVDHRKIGIMASEYFNNRFAVTLMHACMAMYSLRFNTEQRQMIQQGK